MSGSETDGTPLKIVAIGLLLVINAMLLGLNVSKHFDLFGSTPTDGTESSGTGDSSGTGGESSVDGGLAGSSAWSIDGALDGETTCDNPASGDPILIGYAADYGQRATSADIPAVEAATHLATRISCTGGVAGRPVQVDVVDVSEGAEPVQALIDAGAIAIIGPPFQRSGLGVLQVTGGEVPVVFATSTESALADRAQLSFLVTFDYRQGASAAAQFALERNWNRAVLFTGQQDDYFSLNPLVFGTTFEEEGGELLGEYTYLPGETTDFGPSIDAFTENPPDVIYSAMLAPQAAAMQQQLQSRGLNIEFIGADSLEASGAYFTPGLDGVFHTTHVFPDPGGRVERLNASIEASSGAGSSSPTYAALAGDAMVVILDAFARAGSDDPKVVGDAIAASSGVQGVSGTLSYEGAGKPRKSVYIHEVVDGAPTLAQEVLG